MMLPPQIRHWALSQSNYSPPCLGSSSTAPIIQLRKNICTFPSSLTEILDRELVWRTTLITWSCKRCYYYIIVCACPLGTVGAVSAVLMLTASHSTYSDHSIVSINSGRNKTSLYPIENCITKHYFTHIRSGCETCLHIFYTICQYLFLWSLYACMIVIYQLYLFSSSVLISTSINSCP